MERKRKSVQYRHLCIVRLFSCRFSVGRSARDTRSERLPRKESVRALKRNFFWIVRGETRETSSGTGGRGLCSRCAASTASRARACTRTARLQIPFRYSLNFGEKMILFTISGHYCEFDAFSTFREKTQ